MSASGAAPLPRLGEVFFDVRGDSRSMRLSWYADTGVAVFSIWHGGRCTGTFRLPIDDLGRMIEILREGPPSADSRRRPGSGRRSGGEDRFASRRQDPPAYGAADEDATQFSFEAVPDGWPGGRPAGGQEPSGSASAAVEDGYDQEPYQESFAPGSHHPGGYESGSYQAGGYDTGGYEPGVLPYESDGYPAALRETGGYGSGGDGTGRSDRSGDYRHGAYPGRDFPAGSPWPEESGFQGDVTGQHRYSEPGSEGQAPGRFVPPYVRSRDAYPDGNPAARSDRSGNFGRDAYPGGAGTASSAVEGYPQSERPAGGYFDRPDYLLTADPAAPGRHSGGRHASSGSAASDLLRQPDPDMPAASDRDPGPDYRDRTRP
jgi:hypothetical protein